LAAAARPAAAAPTVDATPDVNKPRLLYDGIIFDMDGTLTEAHIDFKDMRARTGEGGATPLRHAELSCSQLPFRRFVPQHARGNR
jgi:hypothetical protein